MTPDWEGMIRFATAEKDTEIDRLRAELALTKRLHTDSMRERDAAQAAIVRVRRRYASLTAYNQSPDYALDALVAALDEGSQP